MNNIPDPHTRRKRTAKKIAEGKKNIVIGVMNILLHKYLVADYKKSFLKQEPYILANVKFLAAVEKARNNLGLDKTDAVPEKWKDWYRNGNTKGGEPDNESFAEFRKKYDVEKKTILKESGLSKDWDSYVHSYLLDKKKPEKPFFYIPKTIRVTDMDIEGNIYIRLSPGLRYKDYTEAWKVFARHLGTADRLEKPYTNTERDAIYEDKQSGLTYKQLAEKYFPHSPDSSIERVKKIVLREKKRRLEDK